jgi:hypothetical protein
MRRPFLFGIALLCVASVAGVAMADEGMWLFNLPPTAQVKAKYGFQLTPQWLNHVRLSSVRFNNGGSGSFVSPDGLTMTNHHVGATCIHQISTGGKNYMETGFYAKTRAEEAKCPDLELDVVEGIEDVTAKVNASVKPGMSVADQAQAQRAAMSAIEKACATAPDRRCDVVTLYSGAVYDLYKYKKYTDVRLVFAPESASAFFGGDPDNFEFPRYDLDVSFFRVYENGQPVHLDDYFKWSTAGVKDGELVFVSGNPGSTDRLDTMAQLEFLRDTAYPLLLDSLGRRADALHKFSATSAENTRIAQEDLFGIENALKAIHGYRSGLLDRRVMSKKAAEEARLQQLVASDPQKWAKDGDPFADIAKAMTVEKRIYLPLFYIERLGGFRSDLAEIARALVRAADERSKPNDERLREYRDTALPSLEQRLFSSAPIYKSLDTMTLAESLAEMKEKLPDNPVVQRVLGDRSPEELAQSLISGTTLDKVAVRKELWDGGQAAVEASKDPLIVLMRNLNAASRALRKQYDDQVDAVVRNYGGTVAKILLPCAWPTAPWGASRKTAKESCPRAPRFPTSPRSAAPTSTPPSTTTSLPTGFRKAGRRPNQRPICARR